MGDVAVLSAPPQVGSLRLELLDDGHRSALKAACAQDTDIWALYPVSYAPDHFDARFDELRVRPAAYLFAIFDEGRLVGMTGYLNHRPDWQTVEIGNTYIVPAMRGTGLNRRLKQLMIDHGFACGMRRIEFKVDARNARSRAAVAKLGAHLEGVIRAERITWTGHVRDTALYSILKEEWAG